MEWQDMYYAPIDGTAILAVLTGSDLPQVIRYQRRKWVIAWDGYDLSAVCDEPTRWMPLPRVPSPMSDLQRLGQEFGATQEPST